ncbi:MAG: hypothetical protein CVV27_02920 [Candidatus Melainabacteria bacterium HGW-Melainabacteria-1]|nr:MAG: hypothetical protein CVV27_02920 [Candidatus Melainabacteria bacterium HGW-Melainabacteria-1]
MSPRVYLLAASYVVGIALHANLAQLWPLLLPLLLSGWAWSWLSHQRALSLRIALGCTLLLLLGLGWSQLRAPRPGDADPAQLAPLERTLLIGHLVGDPVLKGPQRWTLDLRVSQLKAMGEVKPVKGLVRVHLRTEELPNLRIGDQIQLAGRLALPQPALNFGAFSYRDFLRQQGIHALLYADKLERLTLGPRWHPLGLLQDLRRNVLGGFERHLPLPQARLLGSLLLGAGASPVPAEIQQRFQAAGLQHVLAVSGFQVQLVVLGVLGLCHLLRLSRGLSFGLSLTALWLFVALTGFPASVLRAGVVASLGLAGYLRYRDLDPIAGLSLGCTGLLLIQPHLLFDIGFQFSVLATFGLIQMTPWLLERCDWLPLPVSGAIAPILAAQLWVMPAQLWHFGSFSWLFLPANLLAGLLTTALSWLAIVAAPLGSLPPLQALVLMPASWLCTLFLSGLDWLLKLPSPVLALPTLATAAMLLAYAGLFLLPQLVAQPRLRLAAAALLLALPLLTGSLWLGDRLSCPLRVTFLAVGQGDATLIETPNQVILLDAGPRWQTDTGFADAGEKDILPYLRQRGIARIDLAIISHGHLCDPLCTPTR